MRVPNLHMASKGHLIRMRTFRTDSYLDNYKFAGGFERLRLKQIS